MVGLNASDELARANTLHLAHKLVDGTFAFELTDSKSSVFQQPSLAQYILQEFLRQNTDWVKSAEPELLKTLQEGSKDTRLSNSALESLLASKTR